MNWETISKVALAVLPVLGALLASLRGRSQGRTRLKTDLELLPLIPKESAGYAKWDEYITRTISEIVARDTELTRDAFGTGLALTFLAVAIAMGYVALDQGQGLWWIGVVLVGVFGLAGFATSFPKRRRDAKGRTIPDGPPEGGQAMS